MGASRQVQRNKWREHKKVVHLVAPVIGTLGGTPRFVQVKKTNWKAWRKFLATKKVQDQAKVALDQVE